MVLFGTSNVTVEAVDVTVRVDVTPGVIDVGLNEQPSLAFDGKEQVSERTPAKPF